MNIEKAINFYKNYKRGSYTTLQKQTVKNGFVKIVKCVCRFVNYYNIATVKQENKQPIKRDYERVIIPHILKENTNTKNVLLLVYTTKNSKQKAKTSYFYNDEPITKEQYYEGIGEKEKNYNIDNLFTVKLCDVLSIGGVQ